MSDNTVSGYNLSQLIKRFPDFEPSYETLSHKKVQDKYDFAMAIPTGRKTFLWYTFYKGGDGVFLIDMNKDGRVLKCSRINHNYKSDLPHGTLLYGVYLSETDAFLIEDIYYYKGTNLKGLVSGEKLVYLKQFLEDDINNAKDNMTISMPVCWKATHNDDIHIPHAIKLQIPYNIHHIQYRVLNDIVPFINITINKRPVIEKKKSPKSYNKPKNNFRLDFSKLRDGTRATFIIKAEITCDIYKLYAVDGNGKSVYYNTASIPNYNTSVYMNKHFRDIKENKNIDYIEESEDEDDFQNTDVTKHVDLEKEIRFECEFRHKFKRWVPKRLMNHNNGKVIHISKLVSNYK